MGTRAADQRLSHRLPRDPSVLGEIRLGTVYTAVPLLIASLAWLALSGRLPDRTRQEPEATWALAVIAAIVLVLAWIVARKLYRAAAGRIPIVEVDAQPWRAGGTGQLRIYDPHPRGIDFLEVRLLGLGLERWTGPDQEQYMGTADFRSVLLLELAGEELTRPVDRVVSVLVPSDPTGKVLPWRISIRGRKGHVRVREDTYSVQIER